MNKTETWFVYLFCSCLLLWTHVSAVNYVIHFDRMENIKGQNEDLVNFTEWTVQGRGVNYLINGNFIYLSDMGDDFSFELVTALSPFPNAAFILQTYQRTSICDFYKTIFRENVEPQLRNHTNFPAIPSGGLCPIPKGNYYVKDAEIDEKDLSIQLARGLWKIEGKIFKGMHCVGGLRIFADVKDKE